MHSHWTLIVYILHKAACSSGEADCVEGTTCIDSFDGNFICVCPQGFTGDGRIGGNNCTGKFKVDVSVRITFLHAIVAHLSVSEWPANCR